MSRHRRAAHRIETFEQRRLFADIWGSAPSRNGIDDLAVDFPAIIGTGQTVAVIDTGIDYTHPSLGGGIGAGKKVIAGYDFVDNDTDPLDTDGHGTAVAGVIAADEFELNGFTYRGVAPDAQLVALRIAEDTSDVPLEKIESALQWVLDNAATYNIGIVNLSFGFGRFDSAYTDETLGDELSRLRDVGIAFVSSSGNGGTDDGLGITAPAADPTAISVGAVSGSDIISEFTQRSRNLTILAAGQGVRSTTLGGAFDVFDGTSFAAPAVAGTIALMRQVDSKFTLADIRSMLRSTMPRNIDGDQEIGATSSLTFPRLDAGAAVRVAQLRAALSPELQANVGRSGNENDLIYDTQGVLHFVYYDNDARTMKYATRSAAGNWSAATVIDDAVPNVGTEFSLKLDSFGAPRLAYLDSPDGDLKFARLDEGRWTIERLDTSGVTGLYPSLAIDDNDHYWIAYMRKTRFDLRVMNFDGSAWNRQTLDTDGKVGYSASITLDGSNRPAIVYGNASYQQLKFARLTESEGWQFDVAEQGVRGAAHMSLAFDFENRPHISYYEVDTADLKYAEFSGVEWITTRIASRGATGLYTKLWISELGNSQILYWDRRSNALNQASFTGSSWRISRVAANAGKFLAATESAFSEGFFTASNRTDRLVFIEA